MALDSEIENLKLPGTPGEARQRKSVFPLDRKNENSFHTNARFERRILHEPNALKTKEN